MDTMLLKNIEVPTRIGVPDIERTIEQSLHVDIELYLHTKHVAETDNLHDGIDYQSVVEEVRLLGNTPRKTVERFAEDAAAMILKKFAPAGGVKISVWKKPPLPLEAICVTIVRP